MERLKNYIKQIRGISYSPKDISNVKKTDYVPILKANNIQENGLDLSSLIYIHKSKVKKEQFIKKGDLLLAASSGSKEIVGKNIFFSEDFEGTFGAFCKIVRPNNKINSKYLSAFFKTPNYKRHIKKVIQGANINNLKNDDIDSLEIPIFNEGDQIYISKILSQANNLIQQRKESIYLLDEFLKSTFLDMFGDPVRNEKGWKKMKISQIGKDEKRAIKSGPFGSQLLISELLTDGIPVYGIDNVQKNKFVQAKPKFISEIKFEELIAFKIESEDILITRTGTVGRTCLAPKNIDKCIIGPNLLKITLNQDIALPIYISSAFNFCNSIINKIKELSPGATVAVFNTTNLKALKLGIPPIELQQQFSFIFDKVESLKKEYETSLYELEKIYGVLSQKAFKGELDLSKANAEITNKEIKTPVAGSLEPPKEDIKISPVSKKEIEKFKYVSKTKRDITNLSLVDYYGIPLDIQVRRENIDFDFIDDDLFYQFLLKDHFKNESFTSLDLYEKLHNLFYHNGNMDFDHVKWKNIIFQFLDSTPPLLEQIYDEIDNTVKLKLTDEAYKA